MLLQEIIRKVQNIGGKKLTRVDHLEAVYYLEKLLKKTRVNITLLKTLNKYLEKNLKEQRPTDLKSKQDEHTLCSKNTALFFFVEFALVRCVQYEVNIKEHKNENDCKDKENCKNRKDYKDKDLGILVCLVAIKGSKQLVPIALELNDQIPQALKYWILQKAYRL
ncbi:hypothetical protein C2G38_2217284 [Gigaspora rosea]|uniref:Uncharacterized protein n=1 Tax=Gigaspora rosea TaxID=44941 RepID=A0A397U890_9GLOM|nr:hypothetical protein C2G38_2217284 [Gigaspora rosea]